MSTPSIANRQYYRTIHRRPYGAGFGIGRFAKVAFVGTCSYIIYKKLQAGQDRVPVDQNQNTAAPGTRHSYHSHVQDGSR
ncbi:hypothetical protein MW887_000228 [Aspergillus wentii]|nr:hypothetical protein MW887_000228 [Aspergillus wentii]